MFHPRIEAVLERQRRRVAEAKKKNGLPELGLERRDFTSALLKKPFSLIAEIKPASPSEGELRSVKDVGAMAIEMERSGASALSVLTEPTEFAGSVANLAKAKHGSSLPILAKDFVVDEFQVREAAACGADAVLLIAEILGARLDEFIKVTESSRLACVVECFSKEDVRLAVRAGARIIGVNNRSFYDLSVDLSRTEELAPFVPDDCLFVSESGIFARKDIERLLPSGVNAFLVGTSIMKAHDIGEKVRELRDAGK